jgi:hypothetical protein
VPLLSPHPPYLQAAYSDLKRRALEQRSVLVGSAGSIAERTVKARQYAYRQYYDAAGKKTQDYLGPSDDPAAQAEVEHVRALIDTAGALTRDARPLLRAGYVGAERRVGAILGALFNHAFFHSGGVLVGSHAYATMLNDLGVRAGSFATHDVDLARGEKLAFERPTSFEAMLGDSGLEILPVPSMVRGAPSTAFKPRGGDRLRIDLLAATRGRDIKAVRVPELEAHATALPLFAPLLEAPVDTVMLAREAVIPVRTPRPEALALHKMLVSRLRRIDSDKRQKDVAQAAVLFAALAERDPSSLRDAYRALPRGVRGKTREGAAPVARALEAEGAEQALDLLRDLID